mmetsp:Transcript_50005/g.149341  ORF Transcript_50005/g.149341 Transcript_50005/m.149341 type:complete len:298 (-) Transcript_50005:3-896(-)
MEAGGTTWRTASLKSGGRQSEGKRPSSCSRGARKAKARMQPSPRCAPSCSARATRQRLCAASLCISSAAPRPSTTLGAGNRATQLPRPVGPSQPHAEVHKPQRCGSSGRSLPPRVSQPARKTRSRKSTSASPPRPANSASVQAPARSAGTCASSSATATAAPPAAPPTVKKRGGLGGGGKARGVGHPFAKPSRQGTGWRTKALRAKAVAAPELQTSTARQALSSTASPPPATPSCGPPDASKTNSISGCSSSSSSEASGCIWSRSPPIIARACGGGRSGGSGTGGSQAQDELEPKLA